MHARNAAQSGSRRVSAVSPTMHHSWVDGSRFVRNESLTCAVCIFAFGTRKNRRKIAGSISRESYTLLIPRGKTWVKWREHNNDALINTHRRVIIFDGTPAAQFSARTLHKCNYYHETLCSTRNYAYRSHCDELLRLAPTKIHFTRDITNTRNVRRNFWQKYYSNRDRIEIESP